MNVNLFLQKYIDEKCCEHNIILTQENMIFYLKNNLKIDKKISNKEFALIGQLDFLRTKNIILDLIDIFQKNDISYLMFKGLVLSKKLYKNPYCRPAGDIDIFVDYVNYDIAIKKLILSGYEPYNDIHAENIHHIVFYKNNYIIELHKNILNPFTNIDETYIRNHTEKISIDGTDVTTFDNTATLLHLIYHLYMDSVNQLESLYSVYSKKIFSKGSRFLYRAYEIALFSEKYYNDINWEDFKKDILNQKIKIVFKKMISDIVEIFPDVFPDDVLEAIYNMKFAECEKDLFYNAYYEEFPIDSKELPDNFLARFIEESWKKRRDKNIVKNIGDSLYFEESTDENFKLTCTVNSYRKSDDIILKFCVSKNDFYCSEENEYSTHKSSGVHIILCGTEGNSYNYNSIFFTPKQNNGNVVLISRDLINDTNIEDDLIKAQIDIHEDKYIITAIFTNKFLKQNNIEKHFYMGLVISDCSSKTKERKCTLISTEDKSRWYDPTCYIKFILEN